MQEYLVRYKDDFGILDTKCHSDGTRLEILLRGETFKGSSFNSLEPTSDILAIDKFSFDGRNLSNCSFSVQIPILVLLNNQETQGLLYATFDYTTGNDITLELLLNGITYKTGKVYDCMETALIQTQLQLPKQTTLKTCLSCKYSNYHPVGCNDFGDLYCFRLVKELTSTIHDKASLFEIWDRASEQNKLFSVQETFVCEEFELIQKGDWLYKDWEDYVLRF